MSNGSRKTVLITGASSGIGKASCLYLDARGFRIFAGVRTETDAAALKAEASKRLTPLFLDVTDPDSITRARTSVAEALDGEGLRGVVNNAGISVSGPLEFLPLDAIRQQFEVNVFGTIAVTQAFLADLRRSRGRIVNMSSISGRFAAPMLGPYAMSKFALEAFSDALRRELHPWGIRVSCVEPGAIATPIWQKGIEAARERFDGMPPEAIELYGTIVERIRQAAVKMSENAASPNAVARKVHHALTSTVPKTRYVVGSDAKLTSKLVRFLPDRMLDRLVRKSLRP